ncbi:MAG TPA: MBL fold metallo-hydrolase [Flavobacteriales bacterium]|jgi:phosphoribosyl 1,2-cyclic phosphate phosphodiesterase|nr:MBL fold metallo-hydrolase [Flavobacteriales bacterium]|tara:strand:+ start:1448 stop:2209 length:762 start_codon:yes stop_codon:yes gene_type:complete
MKITFLGTGTSQGIPVIACDCKVCKSDNPKDNRLRTSVLIKVENQTIVIDTGPDFRQQMLRENVQKLDAIVFTHQHKDHVAGMDDVRAFNYKFKKDMDLYCTAEVEEALIREFPYVFSTYKYPGVPEVKIHNIKNEPFTIGGVEVLPIEALHYKLSVFGYRIKDFVYLTDISAITEKEKEKMKDAKVIVLDALRKTPHISHLSMQQAVDLLEELNPQKGYIIHISHLMGLHNEVVKELPDFIKPAHDGLILEL